MRFAIIAVGKIKQRGMREDIDDYVKRIRRYTPCDEIEIRDGSNAEVATRFDKVLAPRTRIVALEVDGKALTSDGLAKYVADCERSAAPTVAWLIGGSYGLPPEVSARAHLKLSLSTMTLPHRLARVLLAEQLYRAFTILRNEPYSH